MKRLNFLTRILVIILSGFSLITNEPLIILAEELPLSEDSAGKVIADEESREVPEYARGELIIKLRDGKTIGDVQELNAKYGVISSKNVFENTQDPQETLESLKEKLAGLDKDHEKWYWQLDKDSQEYKEYMAKIEKEKEGLHAQIEAQEKLITHLEQRQKRAPEDAKAPDLINIYLLKATQDIHIPIMAHEYEQNPAVEYAEPNYLARTNFTPNDTLFSQQWAHQRTQAKLGWDIERGKQEVIIAVVDTGVDYNHEDLTENIWHNPQGDPGADFVDIDTAQYTANGFRLIQAEDYTIADNEPTDYTGHGTHVSGIAAAVGNNNKGVAGVAHSCRIMPVRAGFSIIQPDGSEAGFMENDDIVRAITYAADNGADVLNMSFGGAGSNTAQLALDYAYAKGVLLVAAAGNDNSSTRFYPAAYEKVVAVAATGSGDNRASFSNYGNWIEVAAPGVGILSTVPRVGTLNDPTGYSRLSGTSMASPYVAGLGGLLISKHNIPDLNVTIEDIKDMICNGVNDLGSPGFDNYFGFGRVNIFKTLSIQLQDFFDARITAPQSGAEFTGTISLDGVARASRFSHYIIEVGTGSNPSSWSNNGVTLIQEGRQQVNAAPLGSWDPAGFSDGAYTLRLQVFNSAGAYAEAMAGVIINRITALPIKPGWPQIVQHGASSYVDSPVIADIDNDGKKEIIASTIDGLVFAWHNDGRLVTGFPVAVSGQALSPAVGDIDGDGYKEIVVGSTRSPSLNVFRHNGQQYPGNWPKGWGTQYNNEINYISDAPTLADLNGDGKLEIIVGNELRKVCAWFADGSKVPGWPVSVLYSQNVSAPAVGDIDRDGKPEVVAVEATANGTSINGNIYAWKANGQPLGGNWPVNVKGSYYQPVIGDINGDGKLEVIVNAIGGLYALREDGTILPGFPVTYGGAAASLGKGHPALADLTGDGIPEIILAADAGLRRTGSGYDPSKVWVIKGDGTTFGNWPYTFNFYNPARTYGVVVANIDDDAEQEVIAIAYDSSRSKTYIFAFESNGVLCQGYPKLQGVEYFSIPAVGDIDNDGTLELAAFGPWMGRLGVPFYVFDFQISNPSRKIEWAMLGRNPEHTGYNFLQQTDTTPPSIPQVIDTGDSTTDATQLSSSFSAHDSESAIAEYRYKVTQDSPDGPEIKALTSEGTNTSVTVTGLNLTGGKTYYFGVQARNSAGLWSAMGYSDGIKVNRPPVLGLIGNKTVDEGQALTFSINASDPDGDNLLYSYGFTVPPEPVGANFDLSTHTFTWTPDYQRAGVYQFRFGASDNNFEDYEEITITVNNLNRAPVLEPIGNKEIKEGQGLTFSINANDPDGDNLTYSASNLPQGSSFDANTATFTWTPTYEQAGEHKASFTVSDGPLTTSEEITITVNNINRAPVLNPISNKSVGEGEELKFTISATDPDGDKLNYYAFPLPRGATFNSQNGNFSWNPNYSQSKKYRIIFKASDGKLKDYKTVIITVNEVTNPPVIRSITYNRHVDPGIPPEMTVFIFRANLSDPDNKPEDLTLRWDMGNGTVITDKGKIFIFYSYKLRGSYKVTLKVTNPKGASATRQINFKW